VNKEEANTAYGRAGEVSRVELLDHGYVELVETWGSDERIVEAARMSTGKRFLGWGERCRSCGYPKECGDHEVGCAADPGLAASWVPGDERLLRFLWENKHATPFEMAGATIEVQAPIMVFREWHRHRTQSYNEMSARYAPLPAVDYLPTVERVLMVDPKNHQAQALAGSEKITMESALEWLAELADLYEHCERVYQSGLRRGVPKELARLAVTVGRYSRMRASGNLRNWLGFLSLRMPSNAQLEIRSYATAAHDRFFVPAFPRTLALFDERRA